MRSMHFRTYLFYLMAVTLTLPLLMLSFTQYRMITQEIEREDIVLIEDASALANNLKGRIQAAKGLVGMAANVYQIEGPKDRSRLNRILAGLRDALPFFLNVHFDNAEGTTVAFDPPRNAQGESNVGVDHTHREHWKLMQGKDAVFVSDVIEATGAANGPIVNIAAPAMGTGGKIEGYAVAALNLQNLSETVIAGLGLSDCVVWILDSKGVPIYANDQLEYGKPVLSEQVVQNYLEENQKTSTITRPEAFDLIGAISPIKELGWVVGIFKRADDRETLVFSMVATNFLIFLFLLLFSFMMATFAGKPLTDNVSKLITQVRQGRAVPTSEEKVQTPEELVELQKAFCKLLGKVQAHQGELQKLESEPIADLNRELLLLKDQFELLKIIIDSIPQAVIITDLNDFIRFTNNKALQIFPKEHIGGSFSEVLKEKFGISDCSQIPIGKKILIKDKDSNTSLHVLRSVFTIGEISRQIFMFTE